MSPRCAMYRSRSTTASSLSCSARPGAGKTTTLRVIAGLEKQDEGRVLFDGEAVDAALTRRARCCLCLSAVFALSHHDGLRQSGLSRCVRRCAARRRRKFANVSREVAEILRITPSAGTQDGEAVRRRDAARLDRARHCARAAHLPDGRAALQPRRQTARGAAHRDKALQRRQAAPFSLSPTIRSKR